MTELWKALPGWVRNIVVPIAAIIIAWWVLSALVGIVFGLIGIVFKLLVVVALGAVVVILVKKAAKS
ncbi:DUF5326 family protein [Streptacidiphilus jiangxiensis]|uniref:DUF5326 family protein n=1 Tax=Streptacidiphilus jiangxiensis TaxID=235985 RepID=A0A1H7J7Q8_STRJI|nr:DUF5326 family protein [Streptacidiphilus jiangxiensis]SEK70769.1 hypothetical protein SAMN05414137_103182 [Streptacidiphilus jiangxiensis]